MIKIDEEKKKAGKFALVEKEVGEKNIFRYWSSCWIAFTFDNEMWVSFLEYFQSACERKAKKVQGECAIFIYLFSPNGIEVKEML